MSEIKLIDTHSHINMIEDISLEEILQNAKNSNIDKIILPASSPADIDEVFELSQKYENLYCYLGVHPSEARDWNDDLIEKIKELAKSPKVVGIGEIGLDYYWDKSFNDIQQDVFIKQIKLANELNLPINIHEREAHKDSFDILKEYNKGSKVVMHCFSGSLEFARECIKEGWYIALGGVVTFKNAHKAKEVAEGIPLDRLLLETDAPFLAPVPFRGKTNQPSYVELVAKEIATLREISFEEVAEITTQNAVKVLNI